MSSWAFNAICELLPDDPLLVLELGKPSGLVIPRLQRGRVVIDSQLHDGNFISVAGDFEHVPTLENAVGLLVDNRTEPIPILLLSSLGLDGLTSSDICALLEHLIWSSKLVAGALIQTQHAWARSSALNSSKLGDGLIAEIVEYSPGSVPSSWILYAKPK